jgi:hypothetical protein
MDKSKQYLLALGIVLAVVAVTVMVTWQVARGVSKK